MPSFEKQTAPHGAKEAYEKYFQLILISEKIKNCLVGRKFLRRPPDSIKLINTYN